MIKQTYLAHRYIGVILGIFIVIIALTGFALNYMQFLNQVSKQMMASKPIPAVSLDEPIQAGSIDQAVRLTEKVMGTHPHMLHLDRGGIVRAGGFMGDKAGTTIYVDTKDMKIVRVEDQSNSLRVLFLRLHDGKFFGSEWFSNIPAIGLVLLTISGWVFYARRIRNKKAILKRREEVKV